MGEDLDGRLRREKRLNEWRLNQVEMQRRAHADEVHDRGEVRGRHDAGELRHRGAEVTSRVRLYDMDCEYLRMARRIWEQDWQRYLAWWASRAGDRR